MTAESAWLSAVVSRRQSPCLTSGALGEVKVSGYQDYVISTTVVASLGLTPPTVDGLAAARCAA